MCNNRKLLKLLPVVSRGAIPLWVSAARDHVILLLLTEQPRRGVSPLHRSSRNIVQPILLEGKIQFYQRKRRGQVNNICVLLIQSSLIVSKIILANANHSIPLILCLLNVFIIDSRWYGGREKTSPRNLFRNAYQALYTSI